MSNSGEELRTEAVRGLIITHHPRSPDASPERLDELAGIFSLEGPVLSTKFISEEDRAGHQTEHARD